MQDLCALAQDDTKDIVWVIGAPGTGKTTLLRNVVTSSNQALPGSAVHMAHSAPIAANARCQTMARVLHQGTVDTLPGGGVAFAQGHKSAAAVAGIALAGIEETQQAGRKVCLKDVQILRAAHVAVRSHTLAPVPLQPKRVSCQRAV